MQIYFHSRLCSYLSRVPILVEGTVHIYIYIYVCLNCMDFPSGWIAQLWCDAYVLVYIYIYIYRERERDWEICIMLWLCGPTGWRICAIQTHKS